MVLSVSTSCSGVSLNQIFAEQRQYGEQLERALSQSYGNINNAGGSDFSPGTAVASAKAAEGDAKTNRRRRKILMCARQLVSIRFALSIELRSLFHFAQCAQDEETNESDPARYDIAIDPNGDTD